jgi:hypothetical protein
VAERPSQGRERLSAPRWHDQCEQSGLEAYLTAHDSEELGADEVDFAVGSELGHARVRD